MTRIVRTTFVLLLSAAAFLTACGDDGAQEATSPERSTTTTVAGPSEEDGDKTDSAADDQSEVDPWLRTAGDLRGEVGSTADFDCPAAGEHAAVWGTNTYTDDSSVCTAAVQTGLIDIETGGSVTIEVLEGQEEYVGSTANGVTSSDYGAWGGSYSFPDADRLEVSEGIDWDRRANFYDGSESVTVTCEPEGTPGSVWGTGPFTADSSICTAALFAGLIDSDGGEVGFEFSEGLDAYEGGTANGVTTSEYGSYGASFDFTD